MPRPNPGESKKDYISRFMGSEEARADFPDEKQRLAVAYSMFEKRNAIALPYGQEHPWPKKYSCSFIEPGVVFYQDLGGCKVCGNERMCGKDGSECSPTGETILVKQSALAKMAQSFVGKPVINRVHEDVTPSTIAEGEADGIVTRVWLDDKTGWWMCEFLVWDASTQKNCESPAYSVSCAYEPTTVNQDGGEYHNIPYAEEIEDGQYTHLAIVTNPRYEGARIFVNSKGGSMSWRKWLPGARKNAAPLDPSKTMVDVDGEKVPLQNLHEAYKVEEERKNAEAKAAEESLLNDDEMICEIDGKEHKLGELKQAYRNKAKTNADAPKEEKCPTCGNAKGSGDGEPTPLPDLRKENGDGAEAAAKAAEEKKNADDAAKAAEEKKNADDKAAADMKAAEEKKNADDAVAKTAEEKKNADDKAAADAKAAEDKKNADDAAKALEEKRNAGKKSFEGLRNAREELAGGAVKINPVGIDERLAKGKAKYGSAA